MRASPAWRPPTLVYQNLHFIMKSFIHRRKKRVAHNIEELLTPRAVAYWFADDVGSYHKARGRAYKFSTNSFHPNPVRVSFSAYPLEDQSLLVQVLR